MEFGQIPQVRVEFANSMTAPAVARRALMRYLASDPLRGDVSLAASELVTNVVGHTNGGGVLEMYDGSSILLQVHDYDYTPLSRRSRRGRSGFGLKVVGMLATTWGSNPTPTGKVVWASFLRDTGDRMAQNRKGDDG